MLRLRRHLPLFLVAATVLASCDSSESSANGVGIDGIGIGRAKTTQPATSDISELAAGPSDPKRQDAPDPFESQTPSVARPANDILVSVETASGLDSRAREFTRMPSVVVYGDGRVIFVGAVSDDSPRPSLRVGQLDADGLVAVHGALTASGLGVDGLNLGPVGAADAGVTTLIVAAVGGPVVHEFGVAPSSEASGSEQEARAHVLVLLDSLDALISNDGIGLGAVTDFVASRWRLLVTSATPADPGALTSWSSAMSLAQLAENECVSVEDPSEVAAIAGFAATGPVTFFQQLGDEEVYEVRARPVLPHEMTCPL